MGTKYSEKERDRESGRIDYNSIEEKNSLEKTYLEGAIFYLRIVWTDKHSQQHWSNHSSQKCSNLLKCSYAVHCCHNAFWLHTPRYIEQSGKITTGSKIMNCPGHIRIAEIIVETNWECERVRWWGWESEEWRMISFCDCAMPLKQAHVNVCKLWSSTQRRKIEKKNAVKASHFIWSV